MNAYEMLNRIARERRLRDIERMKLEILASNPSGLFARRVLQKPVEQVDWKKEGF